MNDPIGSSNVRQKLIYLNNTKWGEVRLPDGQPPPIYNITRYFNVNNVEPGRHHAPDDRMMQSFSCARKTHRRMLRTVHHKMVVGHLRAATKVAQCLCMLDPQEWRRILVLKAAGDQCFGRLVRKTMRVKQLRYKKGKWGETFDVGAGIGYA